MQSTPLSERITPPDPHRFKDVDDKRVLNETGMLARPSFLTRIMMWLFFRGVGFDDRHSKTIRGLAQDGDIVYVMTQHSVLNYLFFNYVFRKRGLPLAFVANTITTMLIFRPLWAILMHGLQRLFGYYHHQFEPHERVSYALSRHRASLVFLKKSQLWPWSTPESTDDSFLETILEAQLSRMQREGPQARHITVVPQLLIWAHDPERHTRSFWRMVFGTPEAPFRFRRVLNFFINRRSAFGHVGKPIDLYHFCERHADSPDLLSLAAALRAEILDNLEVEERVIEGPALKPGKQIRREIIEDEKVQQAVAELAEELGLNPQKTRKDFASYVKEIAANFSMFTIELSAILMALIFGRIYQEIVVDQEGIEKIREAARKTPLVLLPCHRSHFDYLVLSYIFYTNALVPPHIAAGRNLNFFPFGPYARRNGAFFIRRSFKGNRPYALAFREYIKKLMNEGFWIEFFIEGGRSRTGKMLQPKFGILKTIVDAITAGEAPDVHFVPVHIGYEHVVEEKSFSRELGGGTKKKENFTALLSASKVLWNKHGRIYLNFGEPISCHDALQKHEDRLAKAAQKQRAPMLTPAEKQSAFLERLGYQVVDEINRVAMVTPPALVAAALLIHPRRGIDHDTLVARVGTILDYVTTKGARLSRPIEQALQRHRDQIAAAREILEDGGLFHHRFALGEQSPVARARGNAIEGAIKETLVRFIKAKQVEVHEFDDSRVYVPVPETRINLDFYKNNIVHHFISEAILAAAIRGTLVQGVTDVARVMETTAFLSRTFKHEFIFDPTTGFATQFAKTLTRFDEGGLIRRLPGEDFTKVQIRIPESGQKAMFLLHRTLLPWIEAYWLIAEALDLHVDGPISESHFIAIAQDLGKRRFQVGDIACPEATSSVNFKHALSAWEEFGFIERPRKGRERMVIPKQDEDGSLRLKSLREQLHTLFC